MEGGKGHEKNGGREVRKEGGKTRAEKSERRF